MPAYLAEFVTKKPPIIAQARQTRPITRSRQKPRVSTSSKPDKDATLTEVHGAVESVIGHKAGDEQPLMEAGLDSLGSIFSEDPLLVPRSVVVGFPCLS